MVGPLSAWPGLTFSFLSSFVKANLVGGSVTLGKKDHVTGGKEWDELVKEALSRLLPKHPCLTADELNRLTLAFIRLPLAYFHHGLKNRHGYTW